MVLDEATTGGLKAGKLFAEACMGGLGEELHQNLSYKGDSDVAVIALKMRKPPTEKVAEYITRKALHTHRPHG